MSAMSDENEISAGMEKMDVGQAIIYKESYLCIHSVLLTMFDGYFIS